MAEDELKTMLAVERVKERRTARQHGPACGEVGQLVACTAWSEKTLKHHGGNGEQRGRGEEAQFTVHGGRFLFFSNSHSSTQ